MPKRHELPTRSFGAEPALPGVSGLADWIAEHRGRSADITTFLLDQSLVPQVTAGIGLPCAGGKFYASRLKECLSGLQGNRAAGELYVDSSPLIEDAAGIVVQKKGAWCAMPAPDLLGITDDFYRDEDEWNLAITGAYRTMMRAMRDTGVAGHVLVADRPPEDEVASLARQKVFWFIPSPDRESLATVLEHQHQVAVPPGGLETLFGLMDEYRVARIILTDPDPDAIRHALARFDPDQVTAGGYCTKDCGDYWKDLVSSAGFSS